MKDNLVAVLQFVGTVGVWVVLGLALAFHRWEWVTLIVLGLILNQLHDIEQAIREQSPAPDREVHRS